MLQKSKSKKAALTKYALIVPMLLGMLLYVSCTDDNTPLVTEEQSIEQQIEELKASLNSRDNITKEEYDKLLESIKEIYDNVDKESSIKKTTPDANGNIPFSVIDEVPVFPGCESLATNEERKNCMSQNISKFVNDNFNTGLGKELNFTGTNRIFVSFKIDKNGFITNMRTRSPHPDLDLETQRVITLLPKMEPGKQDGEPVGVLYTLPITFKIAE